MALQTEWASILVDHARRYPGWRSEDVYKLLHQAVMGSEHAAPNEASARAWLARELAELGTGPDEPLLDRIAPDGAIVRVHLRPFVRRDLDEELLLAAFLRTAADVRGSVASLEEALRVAEQLAAEETLGPRQDEMRSLHLHASREGFPALHHSRQFAFLYRPAYRVVSRAFLTLCVGCEGMEQTEEAR